MARCSVRGGKGHARMTFGTSTALLDEMVNRIPSGLQRPQTR
ncbi:MAG: hypothetical protein Ct9H300mP12_10650 [Acidimicrobiales bacterium]|nr:MAG: hypothetical protein Ct9H300mP12_10650 [Acidimicrobiales bacterium]